jgi:hypothetical protein
LIIEYRYRHKLTIFSAVSHKNNNVGSSRKFYGGFSACAKFFGSAAYGGGFQVCC